jgi:glycosyltransferase involved in cell wall biosynthesis
MTGAHGEQIHANGRFDPDSRDVPLLSIVSPTWRHDPRALLDALAREAASLPVELVVVDDGSGDPALAESLIDQIERFPAPARVILLHANIGRSQARNRLITAARSPFLLFLDSDMLPDAPDFLARWLGLIERQGPDLAGPDVAYGGFSVLQVPDTPDLKLARALALRMDCQGAAARNLRGVMAVATSNLLVRASVLRDVPFDAGFSGWGWEDAEWAVRASTRYGVIHVDNPATHLGLDPAPVILRKFAQAGPNFALAAQRHPAMLNTPGSRVARLLSGLPSVLVAALIPVLQSAALNAWLPVRFRATSARLFRAAHAALGLKGLGVGHSQNPSSSLSR